jgi:ribosomal-protein-alanine N-acetyltransferase
MQLSVSDGFYLSEVQPLDKEAYLEYFNDGEISACTPLIPYPYTQEAADWWISHRAKFRKQWGKEISFVIRNTEGMLIGAVGAEDFPLGESHRAEVGFWLARDYRRRGITTAALSVFVSYAFEQLGVVRLTAHTLDFNIASARVLEKNRFRPEGLLRKHTRIRNELFDTVAYGLLKEDWRTDTLITASQQ